MAGYKGQSYMSVAPTAGMHATIHHRTQDRDTWI